MYILYAKSIFRYASENYSTIFATGMQARCQQHHENQLLHKNDKTRTMTCKNQRIRKNLATQIVTISFALLGYLLDKSHSM